MRTILGILLLSVLAAPLVGTYASLRQEKRRVKKEVKKRLMAGADNIDLVFFQFSKHDSETLLRWEHEREFEYEEQMYDVVKKIEQGDSILLWCWWDHEETALNKQLRQLLAKSQNNDPCRHEKERRLVCFFLSLFFVEIPNAHLPCISMEYVGTLSECDSLQSIAESPPPSPPPDGKMG
ncbi:MAG: hypothetical protein KF734_03975 [Saprospiraceae bacterium]|nr:hypothetical protein [Saprospiraceae bacterium]